MYSFYLDKEQAVYREDLHRSPRGPGPTCTLALGAVAAAPARPEPARGCGAPPPAGTPTSPAGLLSVFSWHCFLLPIPRRSSVRWPWWLPTSLQSPLLQERLCQTLPEPLFPPLSGDPNAQALGREQPAVFSVQCLLCACWAQPNGRGRGCRDGATALYPRVPAGCWRWAEGGRFTSCCRDGVSYKEGELFWLLVLEGEGQRQHW